MEVSRRRPRPPLSLSLLPGGVPEETADGVPPRRTVEEGATRGVLEQQQREGRVVRSPECGKCSFSTMSSQPPSSHPRVVVDLELHTGTIWVAAAVVTQARRFARTDPYAIGACDVLPSPLKPVISPSTQDATACHQDRTMVLVWSEDFEGLSANRPVKVNTKRVIALVIGLQPKGRAVLAYDCPNQPDKPRSWTEAWTRWEYMLDYNFLGHTSC